MEAKMALKYIFVNLKRFDVPPEAGGVNRIASPARWAETIISGVCAGIKKYRDQAVFTFFFPEAHIAQALAAKGNASLAVGCQSVYWDDVTPGGNFGAFTSVRPAAAMEALGCEAVIIGHCEERRTLAAVFAEADVSGDLTSAAINRLLGRAITAAKERNLAVLYCIGEKAEEQAYWQDVLSAQIDTALSAVRGNRFVIGYEPVWAIGPGKTPPDRAYIEKIAHFIKKKTKGFPVVYGGGLKADNAAMIASIPEIDGGLIALTRFSGDIGFYPDEYLKIVDLYLKAI
jgi:triosephosphate isomerase